MKKVFLAVAAMAMLATACTKDDAVSGGNESLVSFTIDSPELMTRADGDGEHITHLQYAFYNEDGILAEISKIGDDAIEFTGKTTIQVALVEGRTYSAIFWADNEAAPYTVTFDEDNVSESTMTISSTAWTANSDIYDAFYKFEGNIKPEKKTHKIELTRPFAQINIATADKTKAANAGFDAVATQVTVTAHKNLNLATGKVGVGDNLKADLAEFTYTFAALPTSPATATVGSQSYDMLAMNYVLVNDRELVDVKMEVSEVAAGDNAIERNYTTVPVQRNYRTYIVGNLLTTTNEFNVTTVPGFNPNPEIYEVWDGESTTAVTPDANGVYQINTVKEFAWLGSFLAGKGLTDAKISINNSFDMGGYEFGNLMLSGTSSIEGNGNTIMNVAFVEAPETRSGHNGQAAGAAFVYVPSKAKVSISNLSFDNASAQGILHGHGSGGAAIVSTYVQGELTLNKVNVKNSKINGIYALGALVGDLPGNGVLTATSCSVESVVIENTEVEGESGLLGSAVGRVVGKATIDGISVKDVDINAYVGEATTKRSVGGLVGNLRGGELVLTNVAKFEDVVITPKNAIAADYIDMIDEYVGGYYDNYNYTLNGENVYYKTASQKAFEAAIAEGGEVKLTEDVEIVAPVVIAEGAEVTIDLNGKTISGNVAKSVGHVLQNEGTLTIKGGEISSNAENGGSAIMNNGTLIVENATLNGAPNANSSWPSYTVNNIGTMTVTNTTITSHHGAVASYGENAVVTLNNSIIDMAGIPGFTSHGIYTYNGGKVVVNGGTYENKATDQNASGASVINGNVEVNAGTFSGRIENYYGTPVLKGGSYSVKPNANFVATGYKAVATNGKYMVVAEEVDAVVSGNDELKAAIADNATIVLAAGTYIIPDEAKGKTLTIQGTGNPEDVVLAAQDDGGSEGDCDYSFDGATVTFDGVTITTTSTYFPGYVRMKGTYNNCIINGVYTTYDSSSFTDCTFNVSGDLYNLWTWGAETVELTNCTFNCDGKAVLLYGTANTKLTVNNCTFNDNGDDTVTDKAAIETGNDYNKSYELTVNNATVNGFAINPKGYNTGTTLWANKNSMSPENLKVTVDGKDAYKVVVADTDGLNSAIAAGVPVTLTGDVVYSSAINNDANINLNGNTFEATTTLELKNNSDLTMVGGNYEVNGTNGHVDVRPSTTEGSVVVFEDVDFSYNKLGPTYGPSTNRLGSVVEVCATVTDANTKILFKNCTFDNAQVLFEGMSGKTGTFEAEFDGCTFNALTSSAPIYVQNYVEGTIKMTGCTFNLTCTSSTASAVSVSSSTSTSVTVTATNNTINAVAATPYTFDASKGETEVHNVKVNGTPANIKFISYYANTTVNETGTTKTGIAQ